MVQVEEDLSGIPRLWYVWAASEEEFDDAYGIKGDALLSNGIVGIGELGRAVSGTIDAEIEIRGITPVEDGKRYLLVLQAEDGCGNRSAPVKHYSEMILLDRREIHGSITLEGLSPWYSTWLWSPELVAGSGTIPRELSMTYSIEEPAPGYTITGYGLVEIPEQGTPVLAGDWEESFEILRTHFETLCEQGMTYAAAMALENPAGLASYIYSQHFTCDTSAPYDTSVLSGITGESYVDTIFGSRQPGYTLAQLTEGDPAYVGSDLLEARPGERVRLRAFAHYFPQTPVVDYYLCMADENNQPVPLEGGAYGYLCQREQTIPVENGEGETVSTSGTEFIFTIPLGLAEGTYTLYLEKRNRAHTGDFTYDSHLAGNSGATVIITNQPETVVVEDNGRYVWLADGEAGTIEASWEYAGTRTIHGYQYRVLERAGGAESIFIDWNDTTTDTSALITGEYVPGTTYVVEVVPIYYEAGEYVVDTFTYRAPGVVFDTTGPVIENISIPEMSTSSGLVISFDPADSESGIRRTRASLRKLTDNGDGTSDWQDLTGKWHDIEKGEIRISNYIDLAGLGIADGDRIKVSLQAENNCGIMAMAETGVTTIDNTPPPAPDLTVLHPFLKARTEEDGTETFPGDNPVISWAGSEPDPVSGTREYLYTIVESKADAASAPWYTLEAGAHHLDAGEIPGEHLAELGYTREHGDLWYAAVKTVNKAGLESPAAWTRAIMYDTTAPVMNRISLLTNPLGEEHRHYLSENDDLTALYGKVDGNEDVSGEILSFTATLGTIEGDQWQGMPETRATVTDPGGVVPLGGPADPGLFEDGQLFGVEGTCEAVYSNVGYSLPTVLSITGPVITGIATYVAPGGVYSTWNLTEAEAAVTGTEIRLYETGNPVPAAAVLLDGTPRDYLFECDSLTPGLTPGADYQVEIRAVDEAGHETIAAGNTFTYDQSKPVVNSISLESAYIFDTIVFSVEADDPESGIIEYAYAVGTADEDSVYSGGWKSVFHRGNLTDYVIAAGSMEQAIEAGTPFYVTVQAKNEAGLWSDPAVSSPMAMDESPPVITEVTTPGYVIDRYMVRHVNVALDMSMSGLETCVAGVVEAAEAGDVTDLHDQPKYTHVVLDVSREEDLLNRDIQPPFAIADGIDYVLAVQVSGGNGVWSNTAVSAPFRFDESRPVMTMAGETIVVNDYEETGGAVRVTGDAAMTYQVNDEQGNELEIAFYLARPDRVNHVELTDQLTTVVRSEYNTDLDLALTSACNLEYGTYGLYARMDEIDDAGQFIRSTTQYLRDIFVNMAPVVTLQYAAVNPGETIDFMNYLTIEDDGIIYTPGSDGDEKYQFAYAWDFDGDRGPDWEYTTPGSPWPGNPEQTYADFNFEGHLVSVTVTDTFGKSSAPARALVFVMPTKSGRLAADEEWRLYDGYSHYAIVGDVMTGGHTLIIREGVTVIVMGSYGLYVENGGTLAGSEGITIRFRDDLNNSIKRYWKGIKVENGGTISLEDATVKDAERGLAVEELMPGSSTDPPTISALTDTTFEANKTGLHVLGLTQEVNRCVFRANRYYALKEDLDGEFILRNCEFYENGLDKSEDKTGNYYDYYDDDTRTVLRAADENIEE